MEALRKIRSWVLATTTVAAGALLLWPAQASGVPLASSTHYILDQAPYHHGEVPNPGVNVPAGMSESMIDMGFIRLASGDFTVVITGVLPPNTVGATVANPVAYGLTYSFSWNGTIMGMDPSIYLSEYGCGEGNGHTYEDCDLMRDESGNVRIKFDVYSMRWDENINNGTPFGQLPVINGGFLASSLATGGTSFSDVAGPILSLDAHDAGFLGNAPGLFEVEHGMAVKFHLPDDDNTAMAVWSMQWDIAEDGNALYGNSGPNTTRIRQSIAAYVYTVPEPFSGLLLASALVALALAGRRRA